MHTYRVSKGNRHWHVYREFDRKLSRCDTRGSALSQREATSIARLLAGWSGTVVVHDSVYPMSLVGASL